MRYIDHIRLFHTSKAVVKNPPANVGDSRDVGLIPGLGRPPEAENSTPLQYSCLENSMDRRTWWATAHGVTEADMTKPLHIHTAAGDALDWSSKQTFETEYLGSKLHSATC